MFDGCKLILSPFTGGKKRKAQNKTTEKCQKKEDKIQLQQTGDHITKQEDWLEAFLEDKSAFLQNRGS